MRIAVAYIGQETDTFNPVPTTMDAFEAKGLYRGAEMLEKLEGFGQVGGFIEAVRTSGREVEMVPLLNAAGGASGRLAAEVLDVFTAEIVQRLTDAGPLDGFAFLMHGACSAVGVDDVESHLLAAARSVVGDDLPIVVGLDHHANVTERMVELSTAIIGHRTQPHDPFDTGRLVGELLVRVIAGEVDPVMGWRKLRLLSHQEQYLTSGGPMKTWFDRARALESTDGVLSVSTFPMQPWLDVAEGGWAALVVADGNRELAEQGAEELAELAWSMRADFQVTTSVEPAEAVARAAAVEGFVVLSDTGDSVFGGGGGDSTVLLAELLRAGAPRVLLPLVDPAAARELAAAGPGATVELDVGGTVTGWFAPVRVRATVRAAGDLVLRLGAERYREPEIDMGTTVVVDVDNVTMVISERPGIAGNHPGLYEHFGLEPATYDAAVLKTASNFQYFADLTAEVVRANTPGPTQTDITSLSWERVPRPIYPIDERADDWR